MGTLHILSGSIIRRKTKELMEALNEIIQELNHNQIVPLKEKKAWQKPINEIRVLIQGREGTSWHI